MTETQWVNHFGEYVMEPWNYQETYIVRVLRCDKGPESFIVEKVSSSLSFDKIHAILQKYPLKAYDLHTKSLSSRSCIYCDDEFRYRAFISEFMDNNMARIICVDTFTSHLVAIRDLFTLPRELLTLPVTVAEFRLANLDDSLRTKSIALKMREMTDSRFFKLVVAKKYPNLLWEAYLYHQNTNVLDLLHDFEKSNQSFPFYKTMALPNPDDTASIYVCYVTSPAKFFIQYNSCLESIEAIIDEVATVATKAYPLEDYEARAEKPCLAYYKGDKSWYRGQILRRDFVDKINVQFIDYGNTEVLTMACLKHTSEKLMSEWPQMAVQCCLSGYENWSMSDDNSKVLTKTFSDLVLEKTFDMIVVKKDTRTNSLVVNLRNDSNQSVYEMLRKHSVALSSDPLPFPPPPPLPTPITNTEPQQPLDTNRNFYQRKETGEQKENRSYRNGGGDYGTSRASSSNSFREPLRETSAKTGFELQYLEISGNDCVDAAARTKADSWDCGGNKQDDWDRKSAKSAAPAALETADDWVEEAGGKPQMKKMANSWADRGSNGRKDDWDRQSSHGTKKVSDNWDDNGRKDNWDRKSAKSAAPAALETADDWDEEAGGKPQMKKMANSWADRGSNGRKDDWDEEASEKPDKVSSRSYRNSIDDGTSTVGSRSTYGSGRLRDKRSDTFSSDRKSTVAGSDLIEQFSYSSSMCEKIDFNERFSEARFGNGKKLRIKISKVKSLSEIECRLNDTDTVMLELCLTQTYKDEDNRTAGLLDLKLEELVDKSEADGVSLKPSALVVHYRKDYRRAYLNRKLANNNLSVYLYDCGYDIELPLNECFPVINRKILQFPKQFLIGSLRIPVIEDGSKSEIIENGNLRKFWGERFAKLTIIDHIDEFRYSVEITDQRDVSIFDFFLENNLISFAEPMPLIFDPKFVLNRFFNVFVSHIDSFESYYVYLDKYRAEKVLRTVNESIIANGVGEKVTKFKARQQVIVKEPETGSYCRAEILCDGDSRVFLVDIGRSVRLDEVYENCDSQLFEIEYQAVECSFATDTGKCLGLDEFVAMARKTFKVYVRHIDRVTNRLFLIFYNRSNELINIEAEVFEVLADGKNNSYVPYPYLKAVKFEGYVSSITDCANVYVQPDSISEQLDLLLNELYEYYEKGDGKAEELDSIYVDLVVACKSKDDDNWYRARIHQVNEQRSVTVQFLDYGNYETDVPVTNLRVLDSRFLEIPQLTIAVRLKMNENSMLGFMKDQIAEKKVEFLIDENGNLDIFINKTETLTLLLMNEKQMTINETLKTTLDEVWSENAAAAEAASEEKEEEEVVVVVESIRVFVSHVNSINDFFVQNESDQNRILDLLAELNSGECTNELKELNGGFEIGRKCLTKFSEDDQWYRAEVIDCDPEIVTVRFYDYGNVEVLTIADGFNGNIKEFRASEMNDAMFKNRESFAKHCSLNCREINGASDGALNVFREFTEREDPLLLIDCGFDTVTRKYLVDLKAIGDGNQSIIDELVAKKLVFSKSDVKIERRTGYVSHFESLNRFWIQFESNVEQLEAMAEALVDFERLTIVENDRLEVGAIYAARFPDDGLWYRAKIIDASVPKPLVSFIDYGNTAAIETECRELSAALANGQPALAKQCALRKPGNEENFGQKWSAKANEQFRGLAADGATVFVVKFQEQEELLVDLFLIDDLESNMETNVINQLDLDEKEIEMVQSLQKIEGKISSFVDMDLFWFQSNDMIRNLEQLETKLVGNRKMEAIVSKIGTVFDAERQKWSRCVVTAVEQSDSIRVQLIDYGPTILVRELFELDDDLCIIPKLTMQCFTKDKRFEKLFTQSGQQRAIEINIVKQTDGVCELELAVEPDWLFDSSGGEEQAAVENVCWRDTVEGVLSNMVDCVSLRDDGAEEADECDFEETQAVAAESVSETEKNCDFETQVVAESKSEAEEKDDFETQAVVSESDLEPQENNDLDSQVVAQSETEEKDDFEMQVVAAESVSKTDENIDLENGLEPEENSDFETQVVAQSVSETQTTEAEAKTKFGTQAVVGESGLEPQEKDDFKTQVVAESKTETEEKNDFEMQVVAAESVSETELEPEQQAVVSESGLEPQEKDDFETQVVAESKTETEEKDDFEMQVVAVESVSETELEPEQQAVVGESGLEPQEKDDFETQVVAESKTETEEKDDFEMQVVAAESVSETELEPEQQAVVGESGLEPQEKDDFETQVVAESGSKTDENIDLETQAVTETGSESETQVVISKSGLESQTKVAINETEIVEKHDLETTDNNSNETASVLSEPDDLESSLVDKLYQSFLNNSTTL